MEEQESDNKSIREEAEKMAFYISNNMGNSNDPNTPEGCIPTTDGKELYEMIERGEKPVGDCKHRTMASVYLLGLNGLKSKPRKVFASVGYLSFGRAPKKYHDIRSEHYMIELEDGSFVDSGRSNEDVDKGFENKDIETMEDALKTIEADEEQAKKYSYTDRETGEKTRGLEGYNKFLLE